MRAFTLLGAIAWIAAVAWFGWTSMPHLPLDVSASDPATLEALRGAQLRHVAVYSGIALVPAVLLVWLGRWLSRRA